MAEADDPVALGEGKLTFPCEQCGSSLEYAPGTEQLKCSHCGHAQAISSGGKAIFEYDFSAMLQRTKRVPASALGGQAVQCEGCGARATVTGQSQRCAFCGSPVIMAGDLGELIPPESLLPFGIDARAARERFQRWVGGLWFAPGDLKRLAQVHGVDGAYLPYWTYDSNTTTRYRGLRGDYYYVSESYTDSDGQRKTRQVRHTRWRPASGTVHVHFDDVLVCATPTLPRSLIERLEPWDLKNLRSFESAYLSGFVTERYQVGLDDGFKIAEERMEPKIRRTIDGDIGGDVQQILAMNVHHDDVTCKHILLPLWISSFRYQDKVYRFIVNARTGEVAGERPWSTLKIVLTILVVVAIVAAIIYFSNQR